MQLYKCLFSVSEAVSKWLSFTMGTVCIKTLWDFIVYLYIPGSYIYIWNGLSQVNNTVIKGVEVNG